jgi:hypothetical protein
MELKRNNRKWQVPKILRATPDYSFFNALFAAAYEQERL